MSTFSSWIFRSNYISYLGMKEKNQLCTASGEVPGTAQVEHLREKCYLNHERTMEQLANIFSYWLLVSL